MTKPDKTLTDLYTSMDSTGQEALVEYAEYLAGRHPLETVTQTPVEIERPEVESVVAAIKRLSTTYPMLDKQALLHETSSFMMQHMMQGREAVVVIDDMETYFQQQYEQYQLKSKND